MGNWSKAMDTKGEGGGTDVAGMLDNGLPVRSEREGLGRLVVPPVDDDAAVAALAVRFGGGAAGRPGRLVTLGAASPLVRLVAAPLSTGRCRCGTAM
jgi:hypothetical protein